MLNLPVRKRRKRKRPPESEKQNLRRIPVVRNSKQRGKKRYPVVCLNFCSTNDTELHAFDFQCPSRR
jgi:hypothetical protein